MEYQKLINLLHNAQDQPFKLKTRNWVETNDDSRRMYNTNSQIEFKTMLKLSLCAPDAYIHVKGTITVPNTAVAARSDKYYW